MNADPYIRYITFKGETVHIVKDIHDGLWRSPDGTIWAFAEDSFSVDKKSRPGVGFFSWRSWWLWSDELTDAAAVHDYQYSSPAYQAFHTRAEADAELQKRIEQIADSKNWPTMRLLGKPFRWLAKTFGREFWENNTTR